MRQRDDGEEHRERESWNDGEGSIRPGQSVTMSLVQSVSESTTTVLRRRFKWVLRASLTLPSLSPHSFLTSYFLRALCAVCAAGQRGLRVSRLADPMRRDCRSTRYQAMTIQVRRRVYLAIAFWTSDDAFIFLQFFFIGLAFQKCYREYCSLKYKILYQKVYSDGRRVTCVGHEITCLKYLFEIFNI